MPELPFHERLRETASDAWDAMQEHRFVRDVAADRLPTEVFARYLAYEADFVDAAVLIFGNALSRAPGPAERQALATMQRGLLEEQRPYFQRTFQEMQITPPPRAGFPAEVNAFRDGMLSMAAAGSYGEIIAAMLAAEWMYATWCGRAAAGRIGDPHLRQWVRLHAEQRFLQGVSWLQGEVDKADATTRDAMIASFRLALKLEYGFHTAPYQGRSGRRLDTAGTK